MSKSTTAWKVSKYRVISGPYFPVFGLNTDIYGVNKKIYGVFSPNTGKYGPEITQIVGQFPRSEHNLIYPQTTDSIVHMIIVTGL